LEKPKPAPRKGIKEFPERESKIPISMFRGARKMRNIFVLFGIFLVLFLCNNLAASAKHVISLTVDGRSEIVFTPNDLLVNNISWGKSTNLIVDDTEVNLTLEEHTSVANSFPLAGEYWVRKLKGRDGGYAVQTLDGFLLAAVDNPNCADHYVFELCSEPSEISTDWMRVDTNGRLPFVYFELTGMPGFVDNLPGGFEIEFSATIDGSEEFIFSNGSLVIKHLHWSKPVEFYINEEAVSLSWANNYSQEIPIVLPDKFEVVQICGRRTIYPVETADGLVLSVTDEDCGKDFYSWKIIAVREPLSIEAGIYIEPDTLDVKSKDRWLTSYIYLPGEYNVADIDSYSVFLNDEFEAPWIWFDEREQVAMARFNRSDVQDVLEAGEVELTVSGILSDRTRFKGTNTVTVIDIGGRE
jgi:hypothetical protein